MVHSAQIASSKCQQISDRAPKVERSVKWNK